MVDFFVEILRYFLFASPPWYKAMTDHNEGEAKLQTLVGMGFSEELATKALEQSSGNIEYAANLLLTGGVVSSAPSNTTVLAAISQYDLPEGRSACTCMALAAAEIILKDSVMTNETLTACIYQGHELYLKYRQQQTASPEHISAEDVLHLFPGLQLAESGIRQGLLTDAGWADLLVSSGPTAFCITKPPETILVFSSSAEEEYWLVDSHSRPPLFPHAYAQHFTSFHDLLASLQSLFPATATIPGVPAVMMAMYNSVDVYPLCRTSPDADETSNK